MAVRINSVIAAMPDYLLEIHFSSMCFSVVVGFFLIGWFFFVVFWLVAWFWFFLPP